MFTTMGTKVQPSQPDKMSPDIDRKEHPERSIKLMMKGRCSAIFQNDRFQVPCSCEEPNFIFEESTERLNPECQRCGHNISDHEDASNEQQSTSQTRRRPMKFSYETCPREDTVKSLFRKLERARVVYVRGTPASGKSTLSLLLENFVRSTRSDVTVSRMVWNSPDHARYHTALNTSCDLPAMERDRWRFRKDILLIIDEAQASFKGIDLWAEFIKPVADERDGPMIALFGSYGSPSEGPRGNGMTPMRFTPDQRVSIQPLDQDESKLSIFFSRSEFVDTVSRVCDQSKICGPPFVLTDELIEYLWDITNGHPGGIRAVLEILKQSKMIRPMLKEAKEVSLRAALKVIEDEAEFFGGLQHTGFFRSFPPKRRLQNISGLADFFRGVLIADYSIEEPEDNPLLHLCYREGWLQAESTDDDNVVYVFPSRIHRRYIEMLLRAQAPEFPRQRFPSVHDLCLSAVQRFSQNSLNGFGPALGSGAMKRPLEAQYQDEFYRACYELLGRQIHLTSDWSPIGSRGRVDFQVRSMKWGIECVREGDRLTEHLARFQPGGQDHEWIKLREVDQYIVIDFRTSKPVNFYDNIPFLYYAVFEDSFRLCKWYDSTGQLQEEFALLA